MAKVPLKSYSGAGLDDLTDKQLRFVESYIVSLDGRQAALDAGYSPKSASVKACQLLSDGKVAKAIGVLKRRGLERAELTQAEVLVQLKHCVTRTSDDFLDSNGRLLPHDQWNERAKAALDGIEQRVRRIPAGDGDYAEEIETKIKLVSKGGAISTAMKHFDNKIDASELEDKSLDWDALYAEAEDSGASQEMKRLENNE
jgi:phage terminase small subunit